MKKKCFAFLLALIMVLLAVGCGSKSAAATETASAAGWGMDTNYATDAAYKEETGDFKEEDVTSEEELETPVENGRKLIKTVFLSLQTTEFDSLISNLSAKATELGGYIETSSVSGNSYYYRNTRYASYTIRIPSAKLNEFVNVVSELGNVTQKNESVEDVTLQYVDVESRKKALETEQERLMELLSNAENMEDLLAIESKLSDVRYEIESYGSKLRMLDNQIDYSTVNVDVDEVERVTDTGEKGFFEEVKDRFEDSLYIVGRDIRELVIGILGSLPILAVWAVFIAVIVIVVRMIVKKIKKKKGIKTEKKNTEENKTEEK